MHVLGGGGWENGTDQVSCQHALLRVGGPCPTAEGVQQYPQPLSPCSPGRNLSRGSAARWRGASPGQARERSAGLLLPRVTSFPDVPLSLLLIVARLRKNAGPVFSAKWAPLQPLGCLSDFL